MTNLPKHDACGAEWARHHCPDAVDEMQRRMNALLLDVRIQRDQNAALWTLCRTRLERIEILEAKLGLETEGMPF
jgi:hypothetical protein